jgi:hypothetical protein
MLPDQSPSHTQPRRGGAVLGLTRAPVFRPGAGLNVLATSAQTAALAQKRALDINYRLPGAGMTLRVVMLRTKAAGDVSAYLRELTDKAQALFSPHGLHLAVRDFSNLPLAGIDGPVTTSDDVDNAIRHAQDGGIPLLNLKVIFCTRQTANSTAPPFEAGDTFRDSRGVPYVLINVQASNPDRVTLAHEIGHASGLHHELDNVHRVYGIRADSYLNSIGVRGDNNFMSDKNRTTRSDLFAFQVWTLSMAAFAMINTD